MFRRIAAICLLLSTSNLMATEEILLWPNGTPGAPEQPGKEEVVDRGGGGMLDRHVRNVHRPSLTPYLPDADKATGAAVIVCPGGGYHILAIDKEGHDVARWFTSIGVAGFVLKYRLPRPDGHVYPHDAPLQDAQQAIRLVRQRAKEWNVKADRVGIMGFSAGGHLASTAATHFDDGKKDAKNEADPQSSRPNFAILVYPLVTFDTVVGHSGSRVNLLGKDASEDLARRYSNDQHVTAQTPPTFLVHTDDDPVKAENSALFYLALRKAKVPAELHIFAKGGHGYGLRKEWQGRTDLPVSIWPEHCQRWLGEMGFTAGAPAKAAK